jgi:hypothetical protein
MKRPVIISMPFCALITMAGSLDRGERRQGVAQEIGVARGVEQVDAGVFGLEARDRELQGVLQLLLKGV